MKIIESSNTIILKDIDNFDLSQTFDCGQCFRWEKIDNTTFQGVAFDKFLRIEQINNEIKLYNTSKEEFENIWKDYLDLNTDYSKIWEEIKSKNIFLCDAYNFAPGIRILKQDPWETLCSFIISQNNNIPRIKKIILRLCNMYGEKIENSEFYTFPAVSVLASLTEKDLEPIKAGFRVKYILDAAKKVSNFDVDLNSIFGMSLEKACETLMQINGVGPKVSQCTLLYGFHKLDAFPIDVWIKKVMDVYFPKYSFKDFGKYAGVAQQYLYYYSRANAAKLFGT